jgi:hypothetical protein
MAGAAAASFRAEVAFIDAAMPGRQVKWINTAWHMAPRVCVFMMDRMIILSLGICGIRLNNFRSLRGIEGRNISKTRIPGGKSICRKYVFGFLIAKPILPGTSKTPVS